MANPASLANAQSRLLDLVARADATAGLKLGVGTKDVAGATDDGTWQGVASHVDDAAFGVAADGVVAIAGLADETATDSVDEGDAGAVRMTLDRRLLVAPSQYNGTTHEYARGNVDATVFASAARTATPTPFDGVNVGGRGLHLVIDVTAVTATPSVVFTIQGKDALSGQFYTLLASAAITGVGTTILRVYPGLTAAANLVASDVLPRSWRVIATHADADSITYSVGYSAIL